MKPITISEAELARILEEFRATMYNQRTADNITFKYTAPTLTAPEKINVIFTAVAWFKMRALINNCNDEIAWHGVVNASEDRKTFTIVDILVYPQTVSGATVNTDEVKYEIWHQALDDNSYNNLRFQGHSHVNMGTTPSTVDTALYNNMLHTLSEDSYYIFMISNKKGEHWINIYDLLNNVIYETKDIELGIEGFNNSWYTAVYNEFISKRTYTYTPPAPPASPYGITPPANVTKHPAVMTAEKANAKLRETAAAAKEKNKNKGKKKQTAEDKLLKDPFYANDTWPPADKKPSYANNYGRSVFKDEYEEYYSDRYLDGHYM